VFIKRLGLRNFRNFEDGIIDFPQMGAALIGENGQGKTNLLEAIYYLEIFRSFRGARDEQLITFGRGHFRAEGHLEIGESGEQVEEVAVAAGFERDGRRKKVTVNGVEPERVGEAIGRVGAIIFTASDVEIVAGGPGARRRFLDIILSLVEPGYLNALQRYRQILSQRNELLRDGASRPELAAWSQGLVDTGSLIIDARARWIDSTGESFAHYYAAISGGQEAMAEYAPSVPAPATGEPAAQAGPEAWAEAFHMELDRQAERERRRAVTLAGPHRDELRFKLPTETGPIELRNFGSAGQQRTAAIALRMVEAETLRSARGYRPIVMLDDVFAELDPQRGRRIIELLGEHEWGQVLVTSPKPSDFEFMGGALAEFRIEDGRVLQP
jgi:DNA replication and repair protein RecF